MTYHVVTTTKRGISVLELGTFSLCRRHLIILEIASVKPSPPINQLCRDVRRRRDVAFTTELITQDLAELQLRGLLKVHK